MSYPYTSTGYNMYDMISMLQKAIRRGLYDEAAFAAFQIRNDYRSVMWNRMLVISSEDCFGVVTKEILKLRLQDEEINKDSNICNALALMCKAKKSRDACYFACNFVLANRRPLDYIVSDDEVEGFRNGVSNVVETENYDQFGFCQMSLFSGENDTAGKENDEFDFDTAIQLQKAIQHRDMDSIGARIDDLRNRNRGLLWDALIYYSKNRSYITDEIEALREADTIVNKGKKEKDEIFISKAAVLLCHASDDIFESVMSSELVHSGRTIEWNRIYVKPLMDCALLYRSSNIPDWVYDCHTLRGKRMGKTDWDMTVTEQKALYPLRKAYFDDASWIYTYEDDFENGRISKEGIAPIREYAKTHSANPVKPI